VKKADRTAIIVNDLGEAFTGWFSGCAFSPSGSESYYSFARFARREWMPAGSHPLFERYPPEGCWVDEPKVFSSPRAAERALVRIRRYHFHEVAVVS
jgi:hypothetical protein